jgi:hypothetical protein
MIQINHFGPKDCYFEAILVDNDQLFPIAILSSIFTLVLKGVFGHKSEWQTWHFPLHRWPIDTMFPTFAFFSS